MNCQKCNSEMIKGKKFWICEECGEKIKIEDGYSQIERNIIENYPIFISAPYKKMLDETHPVIKIKALIDTFVNILKYISLIIETEYLLSDYNDEKINDIIVKLLSRPLDSAWGKFLDRFSRSLNLSKSDKKNIESRYFV